jgi:hypothetical protein
LFDEMRSISGLPGRITATRSRANSSARSPDAIASSSPSA